MSDDGAIIRELRRVAKRRARLDQERHEATDALRECATQAHAQGIPITRIAQEAGLSRQGVYDLLGDRRRS